MGTLKNIFFRQQIWIAMAIIAMALFIYGEVAATRFFGGTATEEWSPTGASNHSGQHNHTGHYGHSSYIHHK